MDGKNYIKQKVSKLNWFILIFTFILEMVILNIILMANLNISIYTNKFCFWKIIITTIALDLIYILFIKDFIINQKKPKELFNIYKKDVNLILRKYFWILEAIKLGLILFIIGNRVTQYYIRYASIIGIYVEITVFYYILCFIMPQRDNLAKKLKILKRQIKKEKSSNKFILIDGEITPSSFNLENIPDYKISDKHIYMNIDKEYNFLSESQKKFIKKYTIAIIHEVKENQDITKIYEMQDINTYKMYHIMAVEDISKVDEKELQKYVNAVRICDINSVIEYTENLFLISKDKKVRKLKYKYALHKLKNKKLNRNVDINDVSDIAVSKELEKSQISDKQDKYMKFLNIIYQYNYNNRFDIQVQNLPKEKMLFELYRNAYINNSAYQSILIFFNYITSMCKIVEYYLYAKNNSKFDKNKIYTDIIGDNPPIWTNHITLNVYKKTNDILYKNLRENKIKLTRDEEILLKVYLSKLLNCEIIGEDITYNGLTYLFKEFRNKVEAHGIINDANVYAVWNLTFFFANTLNKILKISDFECEYDSSTVKVGYAGEEKIELGKYILIFDKCMYFIDDEKTENGNKKRIYINYFTGDKKYDIEKGE